MPKASAKRTVGGKTVLLVGTTKGGFILEAGPGARSWNVRGPFKLGSKVNDFRVDPRDGRTLLLASNGGHLGPTIFRSTDRGRTWTEAKHPPQFPKVPKGKSKVDASRGKSVKVNFWLEPGHAREPRTWYAGTSPTALFRSDDRGMTWSGVTGFNENPMWGKWTYNGDGGTPDGSTLHSVIVDPRDRKHLYVSASGGGTFESLDAGKTWKPLNKNVAMAFKPIPDDYGQDPHCVVMHPADPDRIYQINHCGIYRLDRARTDVWDRIGNAMPKKIGDIGFAIAVHPTDVDTAWVFPMDGTELWPRTSPGGKAAVYRTRDGGRSWERLDRGLPQTHGWLTVKRQCMTADAGGRGGRVWFGTTSGEIWQSTDGGGNWKQVLAHLPQIYSLRIGQLR